MNFGEAIPIPLDTADGSKVGRDDLTPPPCKIGLKLKSYLFISLEILKSSYYFNQNLKTFPSSTR